MKRTLDIEALKKAGLEGLMSAVSEVEVWDKWAKILAQAGMYAEGTHGETTEFMGRPVQPVVVWTHSEPTGEQAMTFFFPTA